MIDWVFRSRLRTRNHRRRQLRHGLTESLEDRTLLASAIIVTVSADHPDLIGAGALAAGGSQFDPGPELSAVIESLASVPAGQADPAAIVAQYRNDDSIDLYASEDLVAIHLDLGADTALSDWLVEIESNGDAPLLRESSLTTSGAFAGGLFTVNAVAAPAEFQSTVGVSVRIGSSSTDNKFQFDGSVVDQISTADDVETRFDSALGREPAENVVGVPFTNNDTSAAITIGGSTANSDTAPTVQTSIVPIRRVRTVEVPGDNQELTPAESKEEADSPVSLLRNDDRRDKPSREARNTVEPVAATRTANRGGNSPSAPVQQIFQPSRRRMASDAPRTIHGGAREGRSLTATDDAIGLLRINDIAQGITPFVAAFDAAISVTGSMAGSMIAAVGTGYLSSVEQIATADTPSSHNSAQMPMADTESQQLLLHWVVRSDGFLDKRNMVEPGAPAPGDLRNIPATDLPGPESRIARLLLDAPRNGRIESGPDGSLQYNPHPGFSGIDVFAFRSGDASCTVTVEVAPQELSVIAANDDSYSISAGQSLAVVAVAAGVVQATRSDSRRTRRNGVLANDHCRADANARLLDGPRHGQIDFRSDGTFTYVPNPGFSGVDVFSYSVQQGGFGRSSAAAVTIVVDAPTRVVAD